MYDTRLATTPTVDMYAPATYVHLWRCPPSLTTGAQCMTPHPGGSDVCCTAERAGMPRGKASGMAVLLLLMPYVAFAEAQHSSVFQPPLFARNTNDPPEWARKAAGVDDGYEGGCLELPVRPVKPGRTCRIIRVRGWGSSGSTYLHNMLLALAPKGVRVGKDHNQSVASYDACTVVPVRDFRDVLCSAIKRFFNCFNCTAEEVEQLIVERYDETMGVEGDTGDVGGLVYPMRDFFELVRRHFLPSSHPTVPLNWPAACF